MSAFEKKIERKRKRFTARLKHSRDLILCDEPEPNIIICNGGMSTGLEKDHIKQYIKKFELDIPVPRFIAEKGESYSFLIFSEVEHAKKYYEAINSRLEFNWDGPPCILCYVKNVPDGETICEHDNPSGLTLLEEFITKEEETELLNFFNWEEPEKPLKHRQVKHFGYEFRYGTNDVDLGNPLPDKIPDKCDFLFERLKDKGFDLGMPDQLTINKYIPGQGIPGHVDKHSPFGDTILSLSLGSNIVMDWKHHTGKHVPIVVKNRTMMIMQDEARYDWTHGIYPRTWDPIIESRISDKTSKPIRIVSLETVNRLTRLSLTFRWTRAGPCECKYKMLCDSVDRSGDVADDAAIRLEDLHVNKVYEEIAFHFSATRAKPWPKVVEFMEQLPAGSVVVDLGCGNGKNVLDRNDLYQIAADVCLGLLREARLGTRSICGADCVRLDALSATLIDECADAVICIAVVHHFSNKARRKQAIATIARILRPGGRALITVWSKDQGDSNYIVKEVAEFPEEDVLAVGDVLLPIHENRTEFLHNDVLVPWKLRFTTDGQEIPKKNEKTFLRYYHVFDEHEIVNLCKEIPDITVEELDSDEGNYCVIIRKVRKEE